MAITFLERYQQEDTWYGKVIVMEIYHLAMSQRQKDWTVTKTAEFFGLSIGLVSENLKLADALHTKPLIINCKSRVEALKKI
jgi:hypothetical protein